MFATLKILIQGSQARAEEKVKDVYAIELIDQHIRTTESGLTRAKVALAHMIQREKSDAQMMTKLDTDRATLETRIKAALKDDNEGLAVEGAAQLARLENETALRQGGLGTLRERIARLRTQIETQNRRLIDLKHGAQNARLVRADAAAHQNMSPTNAAGEAEALIKKVVGAEDPYEFDRIMGDINDGLSGDSLSDRMADAGYGPATRSTTDDILARLRG